MNLPMILYGDSFRIIIIARETSLETELHEISPFRFGRESRELLIELPFPRNSSGEKEGKERKKERSRMLCKWRVRRKSSSLINYSSTFRARHARYPPKLERTCSRCQIRLGSAKWITSLYPVASTRFQRVFYTPDNLSTLETRVDLCVCSRKIKLSHYRAPPRRQIAILAPRSLVQPSNRFNRRFSLPTFREFEERFLETAERRKKIRSFSWKFIERFITRGIMGLMGLEILNVIGIGKELIFRFCPFEKFEVFWNLIDLVLSLLRIESFSLLANEMNSYSYDD